jgi:hypothetical protein
VFTAFKWEYISVLFWNFLRQALNLSVPFIIKYFIVYLQKNENELSEYTHFWDFSKTKNFEWLTEPMQYAIFLSAVLVVFQTISFLIEKYIDFVQTMIGSRTTGALITMIYKK